MRGKFAASFIFLLLVHTAIYAQVKNSLAISDKQSPASFPLFTSTTSASIYFDSSDAKVVRIAAEAFSNDINLISGRPLPINPDPKIKQPYTIIAGTIGDSKIIDELIKNKKLDVSSIKNKWECFTIQIIKDNSNIKDTKAPLAGVGGLLVIAGSDRRGTAFGIFHLSRLMGVSPFVWWADVAPVKRKQVFISGSYTSATPSVQYRGIFINDEDWGMQPWAAKNMDTDIKDIGPKTYARVFELLLRLKANYIWPAMHPCTKAFYYYKENPKVADDYAIVVGGSHCEPMLRNNVCEWAETYEEEYGKKPGEWRYDLNKDEIYHYWDDRIKEAVNYESVFTVGMRGVHDGSMPGPKDPGEKLKLLESVITDQRTILQNNFKRSPENIPQIFVPYKEVLSLYRRGMKLPDDVTIIWPDDNYGYIRQLPNDAERKRSGGHGVYYHLSYWGSPQDYLWLSTTSPSLIGYEMNQAYRYGAKKLWVFNVGDIKPAEMELQYSMDMAWDINLATPAAAMAYPSAWAAEIFGKQLATPIAAIKKEYYELAQSGKPEHLGMVLYSQKERENRLSRYETIATKAADLQEKIPEPLQDAYFQLVYYPVTAAKLMNEKVMYTRQKEVERAMYAFENIKIITGQYNKLQNGKWDGMMSWHPRDLKIFNAPLNADSLKLVADTLTAGEPVLVIHMPDLKTAQPGRIQRIEGLGIDGKGLTLVTTDPGKTVTANTSSGVELSFATPLPNGKYRVIVKCLPAYAMNSSKQLRYGIAFDMEPPQFVNVHAETESAPWKQNVVNGFSYGATLHTLSGNGKSVLKLILKDENLVINTIEIYQD